MKRIKIPPGEVYTMRITNGHDIWGRLKWNLLGVVGQAVFAGFCLGLGHYVMGAIFSGLTVFWLTILKTELFQDAYTKHTLGPFRDEMTLDAYEAEEVRQREEGRKVWQKSLES